MDVFLLVTRKTIVSAPDHVYKPKHEIVTIKEAEEVLKKFNCQPTELPLIFLTDPAIVSLGVKPGDMIKITRESATAGEYLYYRYVVGV